MAPMNSSWALCAVALVVGACGMPTAAVDSSTPDTATRSWPCPAEWVPYATGGCGPAAILCGPDGGGQPTACATSNGTRPHTVEDGDGGVGNGLYASPQGIAGPWPDRTWTPDAGIASCAPGWVRAANGACDPRLRTDCPAGSHPLPGGTCSATSAADCPGADYAPLPPEAVGAAVTYVRAGADSTGADGTLAHPFASIAAGIANAGPLGWVMVGAGMYPGLLQIDVSVHVLGLCAARVTLTSTDASAVMAATGAGVVVDVRGVTLRGGSPGLSAFAGARIRASNVRIVQARGRGIFASGSGTEFVAQDLVVEATQAMADGTGGRAVFAEQGARVELMRAALVENREVCVFAEGVGTVLSMQDGTIDRTAARADGTFGRGVSMQSGAAVTLTRVVVNESRDGGIVALDSSTILTLVDSILRATQLRTGRNQGYGLVVQDGARATMTGTLVADNRTAGIAIIGATSHVTARQSAIFGTRPPLDGRGGTGVSVTEGGTIDATGTRITDNRSAGVYANGARSSAVLRDCVIDATRPGDPTPYAAGLFAASGGQFDVVRVALDDNTGVGVLAFDRGTRIRLANSVIRNTRAIAAGALGRGLVVKDDAEASLNGVLIADSLELGAFISNGANVSMVECAVMDTHPGVDLLFGRGIEADEGARLVGRRIVVSNSGETGIVAIGRETLVDVDDVIVTGVTPSTRGFGVGMMAFGEAVIRGERAAVVRASGVAIAAVPFEHLVFGRLAGSSVTIRNLFVQRVRTSTIQLDPSGTTPAPLGRAIAYGLHAGSGSAIECDRAVIDGGGYGFFVVSGAAMRLRTALISSQLDATGAVGAQVSADSLVLEDITALGNSNGVVRGAELPAASSLPSPSPICPEAGCN